jgi:uncharacterized protein YjbI with pentapeptide repeats
MVRTTTAIAGSLITVLLIFTISTFPGECLHDIFQSVPIISNVNQLLFAGDPDQVTGRPRSVFSNRLVLTDQSFVDPDNLDKVQVSHSFRGRDLSYAVLSRSDLRKADFTGAKLNQARLESARLENARFGCALSGNVVCTHLEGATLILAELRDANLGRAQLQGADLEGAKLEGADLDHAQLQGANLNQAELQGANLFGAGLEAADLTDANLQGALLNDAELQGVEFSGAALQGADLYDARLQGAVLEGAQLQGANLSKTKVWRARGHPLLVLTDVGQLDAVTMPWGSSRLGPTSFTAWQDTILTVIPRDQLNHWVIRNQERYESLKDAIKKYLSVLDPGIQASENPTVFPSKVTSVESVGDDRQKLLASFLADLACATSSAPYVGRGLLFYGRVAESNHASIVAARLKKGKVDAAACPGVMNFTIKDWEQLDYLSGRR